MEDNNFNKFQQYIRQNPISVGIFVFLQIIFISLLIFVVNKINTNTFELSNLPISNLVQDLGDLPDNSVEAIQEILYNTIATNRGTISSISDSDAKVREGTMSNIYFENINMNYVSFIVDIPSIEQSYQIFNEWSDDATNPYYLTNMVTMAMCPLESQVIYTDFNCQDSFDGNGQRILLSKFLPYFNFSTFAPYLSEEDPSIIRISPISYDIDNDTRESYIQETKDAVSSLGIPPETFSYQVDAISDLTYDNSKYNTP